MLCVSSFWLSRSIFIRFYVILTALVTPTIAPESAVNVFTTNTSATLKFSPYAGKVEHYEIRIALAATPSSTIYGRPVPYDEDTKVLYYFIFIPEWIIFVTQIFLFRFIHNILETWLLVEIMLRQSHLQWEKHMAML